MKNYIAIAVLSFVCIILLNLYSDKTTSISRPIPPAPELAKVHLGYRLTLADSYWLRFLQDVELCDYGENTFKESLAEDGRRMGPNRKHGCTKGWSYHMLDLIIELDPRFQYAASMGPMSLSVVTDDIEGATEIFKKSTRLFPNDWLIHYQAGYHFMVELEDYKTAALYYKQAQLVGAPRWLPLLIAKLQTKAGQSWLAEQTLKDYIKNVKDDPALKARAEEKLDKLEKLKKSHPEH